MKTKSIIKLIVVILIVLAMLLYLGGVSAATSVEEFHTEDYNSGISPKWNLNDTYSDICYVRSVMRDGNDLDLVTISNGVAEYRFVADGSDWEEGDWVCTIMDTNGTDVISDDTVVAARYINTTIVMEGYHEHF